MSEPNLYQIRRIIRTWEKQSLECIQRSTFFRESRNKEAASYEAGLGRGLREAAETLHLWFLDQPAKGD